MCSSWGQCKAQNHVKYVLNYIPVHFCAPVKRIRIFQGEIILEDCKTIIIDTLERAII